MKKIVLLLLITLCVSGCSVVRLDDQNLNELVDTVLSNESNLANQVFEGYKFYLPKGVSFFDKSDFNSVLLDHGYYYYLYIDVVSHQHKVTTKLDTSKSIYRMVSILWK